MASKNTCCPETSLAKTDFVLDDCTKKLCSDTSDSINVTLPKNACPGDAIEIVADEGPIVLVPASGQTIFGGNPNLTLPAGTAAIVIFGCGGTAFVIKTSTNAACCCESCIGITLCDIGGTVTLGGGAPPVSAFGNTVATSATLGAFLATIGVDIAALPAATVSLLASEGINLGTALSATLVVNGLSPASSVKALLDALKIPIGADVTAALGALGLTVNSTVTQVLSSGAFPGSVAFVASAECPPIKVEFSATAKITATLNFSAVIAAALAELGIISGFLTDIITGLVTAGKLPPGSDITNVTLAQLLAALGFATSTIEDFDCPLARFGLSTGDFLSDVLLALGLPPGAATTLSLVILLNTLGFAESATVTATLLVDGEAQPCLSASQSGEQCDLVNLSFQGTLRLTPGVHSLTVLMSVSGLGSEATLDPSSTPPTNASLTVCPGVPS